MTGRFWVRAAIKGALVRDGGLLRRRRQSDDAIWPGLWDLPGVAVEKGETLENALPREFLEETGLRVRVGAVLDVSLEWVPVRGEPSSPSLSTRVRRSVGSRSDPRLDPAEHAKFAWVTGRTLARRRTVPYLRRAMEKALATHDRPDHPRPDPSHAPERDARRSGGRGKRAAASYRSSRARRDSNPGLGLRRPP
jgi:8-oxo-dGTP diphosphatase